MGEPMLTANEYAEIKGYSYRQAIRDIKNEKNVVITVNGKNRIKYMLPLSQLSEEQQLIYLSRKCEEMSTADPDKALSEWNEPEDRYTEAERAEADFWRETLEKWTAYRGKYPGNKTEADKAFIAIMKVEHPEREISQDILYRKFKAYKEKDTEGLIDKRGRWRKGKSSVDETVWQAFLYYWLDEAQPSIKKCIEYTKMWAAEERPELYDTIPSYSSFYRKMEELPEYIKILGRKGEKAFDDRCAPFIKRTYEDMRSNEWWIADNHTFDVMVTGKNGKPHRPYLTAFMDARSGIITGYYVTYNPGSQATLYALRRGILKYGIPENIYVDNGREFLTHDIGGLGHRRKKTKDGAELVEPPGVFKRLGIKMTNAIVRNAKAKIIERRFRDVKDHFSKLFDSYTGGNTLERPERLKKVLKKDALYTDTEFEEIVESVIEGYLNQQPYNGDVVEDHGRTKMEVFNLRLTKQRRAKAEDLTLMMLRSTRPQKVTRAGVYITVSGERIYYFSDELLELLMGKEVYLRYDPDDMKAARVYDTEDRYIMTVPAADESVAYGADKEEISEAVKKTRSFKKRAKARMQDMILSECDRRTALELVLNESRRNIAAGRNAVTDAKVIELQRAEEEPEYRKVIGGADLDIMNKNAERKKR